MSIHSFDTEIAKEVGVVAATVYNFIASRISDNQSKGKHLYNDKYWTNKSVAKLQEEFTYLSKSQLKTALRKLVDAKLLKSSQFTMSQFDAAMWYTLGSNT